MRPRKQGSSAVIGPAAPSFSECPAKTFQHPDGTTRLGRTVVEHCQIVGEVARALIARYPQGLQALFPDGAPMAAASHDIGKVSPFFFEKLRRSLTTSPPELPTFLPGVNPAIEADWGGHAGVSQATAYALQAPAYVPEILGQHHGFSPSLMGKSAMAEVFGGADWQAQRVALVDELKRLLACDWPTIESAAQARLVAGLTSVADWIGSGQWFEDPALPWREKVQQAVTEAGFVPLTVQKNLSFEDVFGFSPRPAQEQLIAVATQPGVYVLEAPMGMGKTEAALFCAYELLAQGNACGIYFALPTQLTSNKIYERFNAFLGRILPPNDPHRALLLHSGAWLVETEMGEEGRPGGAWFNQSKRGLLAPFAVGTLDQALMAAMNVKHGFVRAFGLAGKVVILDEVHTYDAYTGTILDSLVEWLRALQCTVIILSATLSQERRRALVNTTAESEAYPLITAQPMHGESREYPVMDETRVQAVNVRCVQEDEIAISEALRRASGGQQVLWIENTVQDAQQRYLTLAARAAECGIECGLLHSRFTVADRRDAEAYWVNCFGKGGAEQRVQCGRILVGTQVLEQSLDIDADFLVSRFAPTDFLLQRIGRLWRHAETVRPAEASPDAWLLAPEQTAAIAQPVQAFGASAQVYSAYVLCRSLEVWHTLTRITLPTDIRALIEKTYVSRPEEGPMATWLHELDHGTRWRKGRRALHQLARLTLAEGISNTLPESKAQTRYSDADSLDVLLLKAIHIDVAERVSRLTLLNGEVLTLPHSRTALSRAAWRSLSATLMQNRVSVRTYHAPAALSVSTLERIGLSLCFYVGDPARDEAILRVAQVGEDGVLLGVQGASVHDRYTLEYRSDLGFRVRKGME